MKTHYALKGTIYYPDSLCNHTGFGMITENIKDADCKTCLKIAKAMPEKDRDRMRRAGRNNEGKYSAIIAVQRNEGE